MLPLVSLFALSSLLPLHAGLLGRVKGHDSYCCVFLVDGLRGDMALKYAKEGLMPNVRDHLLNKGVWVNKATSVFPSITGAAIPSVLTGAYPGRHGLPSLYFFDKKKMRYNVLFTVLGSFKFNDYLSKDVKTIFEYFPGKTDTWSIGLQVTRGADAKIPIVLGFWYKPLELAGKAGVMKRNIRRTIYGGTRERVVVVYNGWFDHVQHALGVESEALKEHYTKIDGTFGEIVKEYKKLGLYEKTYFVLISDHGQLGFDKNIDIWDFFKEEYRFAVVENDWVKLLGIPLDVRNPKDFGKYTMVIPAGQAHALLYFSEKQRVQRVETVAETQDVVEVEKEGGIGKRAIKMCKVVLNNWKRSPSMNDLRRYPVEDEVTGEIERTDMIEKIRNYRAVDWCLGRDRDDGHVYLFGAGAKQARIERKEGPAGYLYRYTVAHEHIDPLGYSSYAETSALVNTYLEAGGDELFFSGRTWQLATLDSDYPDGPVQLTQIFDTERAPDLYINGAAGYNLIGETYRNEISRHGALNRWESWATLAMSGPGLEQCVVPTARIVDMVPTVLRCLDVDYDPSTMDGVVVPAVETMLARAPRGPIATGKLEFRTVMGELQAILRQLDEPFSAIDETDLDELRTIVTRFNVLLVNGGLDPMICDSLKEIAGELLRRNGVVDHPVAGALMSSYSAATGVEYQSAGNARMMQALYRLLGRARILNGAAASAATSGKGSRCDIDGAKAVVEAEHALEQAYDAFVASFRAGDGAYGSSTYWLALRLLAMTPSERTLVEPFVAKLARQLDDPPLGRFLLASF